MEESYDDIFERCITDIVLPSLPIDTHLLLVPSLEDVHHDFVYPQPPFDIKQQLGNAVASDSRVQSLPNPSVFRVNNGATIGVSSFDVVSRLVATSFASRAYKGIQAREVQAAKHCIEQRSFYPLSVPSERMPLDFSHAQHMEFGSAPSIMVMPSNLPYVVKQVNGVLFINPQCLIVDGAAGYFADIRIAPPSARLVSGDDGDRMADEEEADKPSGIAKHTSVKIERI